MDDAGFEAFGRAAEHSLKQNLAIISRTYRLDRAARWDYDTHEGRPTFRIWDAEDHLLFRCEVLEIGTFAPEYSTWKWGWCNDSLTPEHRARLLPLQALSDFTGRDVFRSDQPFATDLAGAWRLAAISVPRLGAAGCYAAKMTGVNGNVLYAYLAYLSIF